jgi:molecular chaperone DnaK
MKTLAIDLGTTNTVAAVANHVFSLSDEGMLLPSVVGFLPNGSIQIGTTARRRRVIDPVNTVWSSKRLIGRRFSESTTRSFAERHPHQLVEAEDGTVLFETRAGRHSPAQIAALILGEVVRRAGSLAGETRVKIAVPADFGNAQWQATLDAAELAELPHTRLVPEAMAVAWAYLSEPRSFERAVVYDLGGGTFDCAVVDGSGDAPRLLAHASDLFLGGDDIDQQIAGWVARTVLEKHNWDLTDYREVYDRLVARCEEAKIQLSERREVPLHLSQVDPECPAAAHDVTLTRAVVDDLCGDLVGRTFVVCDEALASAGVRPAEVDAVFLAGGSTFLPVVQEGVRSYFGRAGLLDFDPTQVVARGISMAPADF